MIGWLNCTLHCMKDISIGNVNIPLYKTLTSCIICICLTLFGYMVAIVGSYPIFFIFFFCLYYVCDQVCCSCSPDIH
ncbi:unnamed protein product [Lupinus luteus]|uniref:Uncharacterized protein n=1 Tax=Lupinus luteus TaxID=3873 RepID=A0AAV1W0V3_LUPLU